MTNNIQNVITTKCPVCNRETFAWIVEGTELRYRDKLCPIHYRNYNGTEDTIAEPSANNIPTG